MTTFFFGPRWDAPQVDDAEQVPIPVGELCYACGEPIQDDDRGLLRGCVEMADGEPVWSIRPVHTECDLLPILGHQLGVCNCTGFGKSRADALVALERINEQRRAVGQRDL